MTTHIEQALVMAKIRRWRNFHSGWVVIEPTQLMVFRSKLIWGLEKVENFEMSRLTGVERDAESNSVRLVFNGPQGELVDEVFLFVERKGAETVNTTLDELLKKAEEERKRQEEETVKLEKERQEQEKQIREAFANEVWETSKILWLIARAVYSMVNAVITADWSEARQQYSTIWQQADTLKETCQIELWTALKELDEVVDSKNGEEVIKKASHLIKQLSNQVLQTESIWVRWQDHKKMLAGVSPNCNHLPYLLLFGAGNFEALLSAKIEDWAGVNKAISLLRSSGTILGYCFNIELDGLLDAANSAAMERNTDLFTATTQRIESTVFDSFKTKPFKFETLAQ